MHVSIHRAEPTNLLAVQIVQHDGRPEELSERRYLRGTELAEVLVQRVAQPDRAARIFFVFLLNNLSEVKFSDCDLTHETDGVIQVAHSERG